MRICLVDNCVPGPLVEEAASYVEWLGPALAEHHQVTIATVQPDVAHFLETVLRIRRIVAMERPEIIHLNNLSGLTLANVLYAISVGAAGAQPALAVGLHDDRLLRHLPTINRMLTGPVGLAISPTSSLLDQHVAKGFFAAAIHDVIPYAMPYHLGGLVGAYRRLLLQRRAGDLGKKIA